MCHGNCSRIGKKAATHFSICIKQCQEAFYISLHVAGPFSFFLSPLLRVPSPLHAAATTSPDKRHRVRELPSAVVRSSLQLPREAHKLVAAFRAGDRRAGTACCHPES